MSNEREHKSECPDCKVYEFESELLSQHKEWMEKNIRKIIREELHNNVSNDEEIRSINWAIGKVTFRGKRIYLVPAMAVIAFTMVIVDFYLTYIKR
jgi:hypothetical protein